MLSIKLALNELSLTEKIISLFSVILFLIHYSLMLSWFTFNEESRRANEFIVNSKIAFDVVSSIWLLLLKLLNTNGVNSNVDADNIKHG